MSFGNVFRNARALPLWTAMEIRWTGIVSCATELIGVILFRCHLWARLFWVLGNTCSRVNETKIVSHTQMFIFFILEQATCDLSAATPAFEAVAVMWDWANVPDMVTSHADGLPCDQGTNLVPSGRLPSDLDRPSGSLHAGTCAFFMALQSMSLIRECLNCHGALLLLLLL